MTPQGSTMPCCARPWALSHNNPMKKSLLTYIPAAVLALVIGSQIVFAQVPQVNLNEAPVRGSPYGVQGNHVFKLAQCNGPAKLDDQSTHLMVDGSGKWAVDPTWKKGYNADGTVFIPCDFRGFMIQMQFLINAGIVLGVVAAIIGMCVAGFLYLTGVQKNIERAHTIFPKIFWGFIIMLTAWFVVYQILQWLTGTTVYLTGTTV